MHSQISSYDWTIISSAVKVAGTHKSTINLQFFWHQIYFGTSEASRGPSAEPTIIS